MEKHLNIIQLVFGIIAIVCTFIGLLLSVKKLSKEDSGKKIPQKTLLISTVLIAFGLLCYAATKTCTAYANRDQEYDISALYLSSLINVIKYSGFLVLIPLLLNYIRRKPTEHGKKTNENYL